MNFNLVEKLLGMTLIGAEWVLWLLLVLSMLSIAIIFERSLFFFRVRGNFEAFSQGLNKYLKSGETQKGTELCEKSPLLAAKIALNGLQNADHGLKAMEGSMDSLLAAERIKYDKGLVILGTLGNNTPFIGLFGTVIGIIKAFHELSLHPEGGPNIVMSGISEALVSTAIGLLVAIPAVIAYNAFLKISRRQLSHAQAIARILSTYHKSS